VADNTRFLKIEVVSGVLDTPVTPVAQKTATI
jgi:hypothetical protein